MTLRDEFRSLLPDAATDRFADRSMLLSEFIAKEKASGRFAELQKKWFGDSFPDLPVAFEPEF